MPLQHLEDHAVDGAAHGGRVLLDAEMHAPVVQEVREAIAQAPFAAQISDLHVWRVGKARYACIVALDAAADVEPDAVRQLLGVHEELAHVTVEVNRAPAARPTA